MRAVVTLLACACSGSTATPPAPEIGPQVQLCADPARMAALRDYLGAHEQAYRRALAAARRWLDALDIDPIALRERGVKGKKKLVEQLDAYYRLLDIAEPADAPGLMARVRAVAAVADDDRYHDMSTVDDLTFKQDATSYLRAGMLMDRLGLDTRRYRLEIGRIASRLDAHMVTRGIHQRQVFHWYYEHFGLDEPFPLAAAVADGFAARRPSADSLDKSAMYQLTHEIFVPYEYGERLDADPFSHDEKRYFREVIPALMQDRMAKNDPDVLAELVSCMRYLRFVDHPAYVEGLDFLFRTQRLDGSWGVYKQERARIGDLVREKLVLHTTTVAIDALSVAFHQPWNRDVTPPCRGQSSEPSLESRR